MSTGRRVKGGSWVIECIGKRWKRRTIHTRRRSRSKCQNIRNNELSNWVYWGNLVLLPHTQEEEVGQNVKISEKMVECFLIICPLGIGS